MRDAPYVKVRGGPLLRYEHPKNFFALFLTNVPPFVTKYIMMGTNHKHPLVGYVGCGPTIIYMRRKRSPARTACKNFFALFIAEERPFPNINIMRDAPYVKVRGGPLLRYEHPKNFFALFLRVFVLAPYILWWVHTHIPPKGVWGVVPA